MSATTVGVALVGARDRYQRELYQNYSEKSSEELETIVAKNSKYGSSHKKKVYLWFGVAVISSMTVQYLADSIKDNVAFIMSPVLPVLVALYHNVRGEGYMVRGSVASSLLHKRKLAALPKTDLEDMLKRASRKCKENVKHAFAGVGMAFGALSIYEFGPELGDMHQLAFYGTMAVSGLGMAYGLIRGVCAGDWSRERDYARDALQYHPSAE